MRKGYIIQRSRDYEGSEFYDYIVYTKKEDAEKVLNDKIELDNHNCKGLSELWKYKNGYYSRGSNHIEILELELK